MIIAFTSDREGEKSGIDLTSQFNDWLEDADDEGKKIVVESIHTSSSAKGWLMVVKYQVIENSYVKRRG